MNDEGIHGGGDALEAPPANQPAAPGGLLAWLPWLAATGFALFAGAALSAWFALRSEVAVMRDQAALAEIKEKTLRQQIEAEEIISDRRMADLRDKLESPRDLGRLRVVPFVPADSIAQSARAVVVLDPDRREGELFVAALPASAPDKSYRLWLFDSEHPAGTSLALFDVGSAGSEVTVPLKFDRTGANGARYKITIERKDGAPVPEGPVVLASP